MPPVGGRTPIVDDDDDDADDDDACWMNDDGLLLSQRSVVGTMMTSWKRGIEFDSLSAIGFCACYCWH